MKEFRKHLLGKSRLYHCDQEVLYLFYITKEREKFVFFSVAPRKVFHERPTDGDSVFSFDKINFWFDIIRF